MVPCKCDFALRVFVQKSTKCPPLFVVVIYTKLKIYTHKISDSQVDPKKLKKDENERIYMDLSNCRVTVRRSTVRVRTPSGGKFLIQVQGAKASSKV